MNSQNKVAIRSVIILLVMGFFAFFGIPHIPPKFFHQFKEPGPCAGRQWESSKEQLDCVLPYPPVGRWKAVYTKDFAAAHNLPPKGISKDLSPGIDYMEMDVQPYAADGTACLINMLIKKPNDVAFNPVEKEFVWASKLHEQRKLAHLIDLDMYKKDLKGIISFGLSPKVRKYNPKAGYSIGSSFAFYVENVLGDYDYITANANCRNILSKEQLFPDKWTFNYAKASIWGRYQKKFTRSNDPGRPEGEEFFDSVSFINIPPELITDVFKDMPIGGRY